MCPPPPGDLGTDLNAYLLHKQTDQWDNHPILLYSTDLTVLNMDYDLKVCTLLGKSKPCWIYSPLFSPLFSNVSPNEPDSCNVGLKDICCTVSS